MAWNFDTAHSQVEFSVKHMMFSTAKGQFTKFDGSVELNEQNPAASSVNVTIDVASINTNDERRDGHLKSPDFFDVATYPTITFKSTKVETQGENHYKVTGDMTVRDVTRPVVLDVNLLGKFKDMHGAESYAFSITTAFSRKEFGLTWNVALETGGVMVSDQVNINIETQVKAAAPVSA